MTMPVEQVRRMAGPSAAELEKLRDKETPENQQKRLNQTHSNMQDVAVEKLGENHFRIHAWYYTSDGSEHLRSMTVTKMGLREGLILVEATRTAARKTDPKVFDMMFGEGTRWRVLKDPGDESRYLVYRYNANAEGDNKWQPLITPKSVWNLWAPPAGFDAVGLCKDSSKHAYFSFKLGDTLKDQAYESENTMMRLAMYCLPSQVGDVAGKLPAGMGGRLEGMMPPTRKKRLDRMVDDFERLHKTGYNAKRHVRVWQEDRELAARPVAGRDRAALEAKQAQLAALQGRQDVVDQMLDLFSPALSVEQKARVERLESEIKQLQKNLGDATLEIR